MKAAMTPEEKAAYKLGYSRGYNRGRAGAGSWPEHRPPFPPEPTVAKLMQALRDLRDAVDGLMATLDPEDEFTKRLDPYVTAADDALIDVGRWLKAPPA